MKALRSFIVLMHSFIVLRTVVLLRSGIVLRTVILLRSGIALTRSVIRLATSGIRFASVIMLRIVILCFAQLWAGERYILPRLRA